MGEVKDLSCPRLTRSFGELVSACELDPYRGLRSDHCEEELVGEVDDIVRQGHLAGFLVSSSPAASGTPLLGLRSGHCEEEVVGLVDIARQGDSVVFGEPVSGCELHLGRRAGWAVSRGGDRSRGRDKPVPGRRDGRRASPLDG